MSFFDFSYGESGDPRKYQTDYRGSDDGTRRYYERVQHREDALFPQVMRDSKRRQEAAQYQRESNPLDASWAQGVAIGQPTSAVNWHEMQREIYG